MKAKSLIISILLAILLILPITASCSGYSQQDIQAIRDANYRAQLELSNSNNQLNSFSAQISTLQQQISTQTAQINSLQQDNTNLRNQISTLQNQPPQIEYRTEYVPQTQYIYVPQPVPFPHPRPPGPGPKPPPGPIHFPPHK